MQHMPLWLAAMHALSASHYDGWTMPVTPAPHMSYNRNGKPSGAAAAKRAAKKRRNIAKHN